MNFRTRLQLAEAFGLDNRWFCSKAYGCEITDCDTLLAYYIKSGGAADFALRYDQAMDGKNRWYCSEFHRRDIRDPRVLWEYYVSHCRVGTTGQDGQQQPDGTHLELCTAC